MLQIAYEEVHDREGLSKTAQDLKTLATVLDSRARDKMRAEGLSGQESDILLTRAVKPCWLMPDRKKPGAKRPIWISNIASPCCPRRKGKQYEH